MKNLHMLAPLAGFGLLSVLFLAACGGTSAPVSTPSPAGNTSSSPAAATGIACLAGTWIEQATNGPGAGAKLTITSDSTATLDWTPSQPFVYPDKSTTVVFKGAEQDKLQVSDSQVTFTPVSSAVTITVTKADGSSTSHPGGSNVPYVDTYTCDAHHLQLTQGGNAVTNYTR